MKQSKLIKMVGNKQGCRLWTISYKGSSPGEFYILREEAEKLEVAEKQIVRDMFSFVDIRIQKVRGGQKNLQMQIFWSQSVGEDTYQGKRESISFPYEKFRETFQQNGVVIKCLDLQEFNQPKIIFKSKKNLKEVMKHPKLRKKLGKFLSRHFHWSDSAKIELYDDMVPYSFHFREYRKDGSQGIVGGVILHGQKNFATAQYGIHT